MANETIIQNIDLNKGMDYVSYLSKTITEKIVDFLTDQGWAVSQRWVSLLLLFISFGFLWIAMRIGQKTVKWILIVLAILMIIGLIIPSW